MTTTDYTHLLNNETFCFDLTDSDVAGHHDLCEIVKEDGHCSLKSYLNDNNAWGKTVAEVAKEILG